jgi:hypothetical protein
LTSSLHRNRATLFFHNAPNHVGTIAIPEHNFPETILCVMHKPDYPAKSFLALKLFQKTW